MKPSTPIECVTEIARRVAHHGGDTYVVGGAVLAEITGRQNDNYDLEIHGLEQGVVERILADVAEHDTLTTEGRTFGVYRLTVSGIDVECSLPRRDSKTGPGHPDFAVSIEPHMGVAAAAQRRDFTIGAIYKHVLTGVIDDPTGGRRDLADHTLRAVDDRTFGDDPLRVLRAVQLAGRYELHPDDRTRKLLTTLVPKTIHLPAERFAPEWRKLFLKSERPSIGLTLAKEIGIFRVWCPALDHLERNSWRQTLDRVDHAKQKSPNDIIIHLASLLSDLTTPDVKMFLERQGFSADLTAAVTALIQEQHTPLALDQMKDTVHVGVIRRLARRLAPATIEQLAVLTAATPASEATATWLLHQAQAIGLERQQPEPIVRGRDLIARGWKPGPLFGQIQEAGEKAIENGRAIEEIRNIIATAQTAEAALSALQE